MKPRHEPASTSLIHGTRPPTVLDDEAARAGAIAVGLVIAREGAGVKGIRRALACQNADHIFFPEAYITDAYVDDVRRAARDAGKWLVLGVSEDGQPPPKQLSAVVVGPDGDIVGRHVKTQPTTWELEAGYVAGDRIDVIPLGPLGMGIAICYELHFPEVARLYALQGARLIFNPIGTGMWDRDQYECWTTVARARAIENGVFVIGCSHDVDTLPLAFAYGPLGEVLLEDSGAARDGKPELRSVTLDFSRFPRNAELAGRRADLYSTLAQSTPRT
jgi:predicted amidohydrolase